MSYGSESVQVVTDLGETRADFAVADGIDSDISVSLDLTTIAINPVTLDGREFKEVTLPAAEHLFAGELTEVGYPAVPVLTSLIAIPDQAGVTISVTYSGFDVIEDVDMAPVQPPQPESDPTPVAFALDDDAYATDEFYPGPLAEAGEPAIMRDVRLTQIALYPVQYNPARREMRVYRDLSLSLSFEGEVVNPKTVRHRYLSEGFYPIYKNTISNFDQMFSTAEVKRGGLMIIAQPMYADTVRAFKELVEWKHRKGYTVQVVNTRDIDPGDHNPTYQQVFSYIQDAYETWEIPPEYVMIIGDKDVLATSGVVDYPYESYASDHHYACVEGTDYLPELFVARMSVDNLTEFRKAVAKVLKYERNPQMFDPLHWIRGLSVGYTLFATARLTTLWVRQLQIQHGFDRVDTVYGNSDPNLRIRQYLNEGRAMTQYRGEGGVEGWWGPSFYISDLNALQSNQKLGVMAVLTCGTGNFGGECLGEEWLVAGVSPDSLKGGPAYYGVSDGFTHTKWNNPIMIGYFWGIFGENNYHFAAAAVRGKLQQYATFPRERGPSGWVEQYFHTYNMLGDPELELRTAIPITMLVTRQDTVAFGLNHYEVTVTDTIGNPIKDAYVTLIKNGESSEELFSVEKTDEMGNAVLYFDGPTLGEMDFTVSGHNLIPYLGTVQIVQSEIAVGADSTSVDDDMNGSSFGDANGQASPGETIELTVVLKNFGNNLAARGVVASLEAADELVTIFDGARDYGDIGAGEIQVNGAPYIIRVNSQAKDGEVSHLKLNVSDENDDSWYSLVRIPISAPRLAITNVAVTDENNRLDQNDTATVIVTLSNFGTIGATDVSGFIISHDDYASITGGACSFGPIPVDSSRSNAAAPVTIIAPAEIFDGHSVNLLLDLVTASGAHFELPFSITVGAASTSDPTGPDAYGYYIYGMRDTAYSPHPTYNWINTAPRQGGQGTRLSFGSNTDDKSILVTAPFNIGYYGHSFDRMIVSINGFVAFDTAHMDMGGNYWANFFNWPIPDPGNAAAQISPFWDDLRLGTSNSKGVFTWHDTTNHLFVIEYDSLTNVNGSAVEWFEIIFMDPAYHPTLTGDSEILLQYRVINNRYDSEENYSSVGIEDPTETIGIQYSYDRSYPPTADTLITGMALKITTNTGRGGISGTVTLEGGEPAAGAIIATASGQHRVVADDGSYWFKYLPPGTADLSVELPGYFPGSLTGVYVVENTTNSNINFELTLCPIPDSLTATDSLDDRINISWSPVSHPDLMGYNLYRSRWEGGGFMKVNGTPLTDPSYSDRSLPDSGKYWYYATAVYQDSIWEVESLASNHDAGSVVHETGAGDDVIAIPREFFLAENYPNPFNPSTVISYGLPRDAHVRLEIFNILGQRVRLLYGGLQRAGYRQVVWDGSDGAGEAVSSGVYFYRLSTADGSFNQTKKMLLVK
jgi:hypothetical protein